MKRKNNAMFKIWFSIVYITIVLFVSKYIWSDDMDSFIFSWLIILSSAIIYQLFIKSKYTEKVTHIIFIVMIIVITMFSTYLMNKYIDIDAEGWWIFKGTWWNHLLTTLLESLLLMAIKITLWMFLKINHGALETLITEKEKAHTKISKLEEENEVLRNKINEYEGKAIKENSEKKKRWPFRG